MFRRGGVKHVRSRVLLLVCGMALLAVPAASAEISSVPRATPVPNGFVSAIATTRTTTYIAGGFTRVGPRTGPGVGINAQGRSIGLPEVDGSKDRPAFVKAVVADGSGGFYIGGDFARVGGLVLHDLAHIRADGSVDPAFAPNPSGEVKALAVSASILYVGGSFTSIGGKARHDIAAIDRSTGRVTPWDPSAAGRNYESYVAALAVSGSNVYAGGHFRSIGGKLRHDVAALDSSTGKARPWRTVVNRQPHAAAVVSTLAVAGSTVYVGGSFRAIGGQPRANLGALDRSTGKATAWDPDHAGGCVNALAISGSTLYVGGHFWGIGGRSRVNMAALDRSTGKATAWDPNVGGDSVYALAVSGSTVYAGGRFTSIGGRARSGIAAIDRSTGKASGWNPGPNGDVYAIAASGSTVYVGGAFTLIGGESRNHLAAIDNATGAVTSWNPGANNAVLALAVSGSVVYAGGDFTSIGGRPRNGVAAIDASTGEVTTWDPSAGGYSERWGHVKALAVSGSIVYVGGSFTSIGGATRHKIAALGASTGKATSWNPSVGWEPGSKVDLSNVVALAVSDSTVYVGGSFGSVGGQPRGSLAAVDRSTGKVTAWDPPVDGSVNALAVSGSAVYVGGSFAMVGGRTRVGLAAIDSSTGRATSWDPAGDPDNQNSIEALAVSGRTVYVGGWFNRMGGKSRHGIAAIDRATGEATGWNPDAGPDWYDLSIGDIAVSDAAVYVGGNFTDIGGVPQSYFAAFANAP